MSVSLVTIHQLFNILEAKTSHFNMSVFTKQLRKKLFQANYLMFATHELSKFCENLPLDDTKFRPNNNSKKYSLTDNKR